ncbi:MAG: SRPBCC family protein [Oligoflexia bacterium]|nr:SRPBCC family protein [Oligoflexia bacterium]
MAKAEFHETFPVDAKKLFDTIVKYEDYPEFVTGCSSVSVKRDPAKPGQVRASYQVNMIKELSYTLDHIENPEKLTVEWKLVSSDFMKSNTGKWTLKSLGKGKTDVSYSVEIDFSFPVPGLILNRVVKGSLGPMVKSFVERSSQ